MNWRFLGERIFLSQRFSQSLLAAHATLLGLFVSTSWLHVSVPLAVQKLISPPSAAEEAKISRRVTPNFILTTILSAVIVGCLCARSLHYQFFAYIAWSTPFLLWRSGLDPISIYAVWGVQELAWNVYPSTDLSSMTVVICLAITVLSVLVGTDPVRPEPQEDKTKLEKSQ